MANFKTIKDQSGKELTVNLDQILFYVPGQIVGTIMVCFSGANLVLKKDDFHKLINEINDPDPDGKYCSYNPLLNPDRCNLDCENCNIPAHVLHYSEQKECKIKKLKK